MLKIDNISNIANYSIYKQNKNVTNPIKEKEVEPNQTQEISGVPKSYITFRGVSKNDDLLMTDGAKALFKRAEDIAKQLGNEEITPYHIIEAAIAETEENLNAQDPEVLASGTIESISTLNKLANNYSNKNMLLNQRDFDYFIGCTSDLETENASYLEALPAKEELKGKEHDIPITQSFRSMLEKHVDQIHTMDAYMLLGNAFNAIAASGLGFTSDYLKNFKSITYYKTPSELTDNYMKAYDSRAIDAWNKLALGSNLYITYNDRKEADRIEASLVNTKNAPKHGNFSGEDTVIYAISEEISPAELFQEVQEIEEGEPDKQRIFMVNIDSLMAKSVDENGEVSYPLEVLGLLSAVKENTKFIFFQHNNSYYDIMQQPMLKRGLSNFIQYSIPPMHTFEAQEVLNNNRKLLKGITTPFSKEAKNKTIAYADKIDGIFPDKAIDLMKRIAIYYGDDKKRITPKDVDEFAAIASDLFKQDNNSNIIYDTGKNLNSLYGKDTTKKDIEAIVRQIKTGKIGTRGYIMYSQDEEAGSGRRFTAQAIAGEAKVPYMEIASSDFAMSAEGSDGVKTAPSTVMSRIFSEVKKAAQQNENKTAILFVNNFEDFAFSGPYLAGYKQAMAQMEKEMAKAEAEKLNIIVIGSTDSYYADAIPLVARGFNQNIVIDTPAYNKKSRKEILENRIKHEEIKLHGKTAKDREYMINKLVKLTEYMSFVEIKTMVEKAKQIMIERDKSKATIGDFIEAYLQLATGRTSRPEMPEYNKRATTSHECGHALNLEIMEEILKSKGKPWHEAENVNFITLDPRGTFLGAVFEGKGENSDYPFEAMFTGLVCAYGGYSCEKMFFDMDGSAGISQDLAQATSSAKRGIEYFGFGHNTGKISNAAKINSGRYNENVFKDMDVILTNAQIASDLITDVYKGFNKWFTDKYSKLIGTDDCMIDGDDFRAILAKWKQAQPNGIKEEFEILSDMIMDIIKHSKQGKIYGKIKV